MERSPPEESSRRRFLIGGLSAITLPVLRDWQPIASDSSSTVEMTYASRTVDRDSGVFVNQVGYRSADEKLAIVRLDTTEFKIVDTTTSQVVYSGTLSPQLVDPSSNDTVRWANFSDVTTPGTYRIVTDNGSVASTEFSIGSDVWLPTLRNLCRQYTLRRSNTQIKDPDVGFDIERGHPQDATAALYFTDEFHAQDESLDVSGGWYDAGDYGKYVPTGAVTVAQLLLAYELSPGVFTRSDMQFLDEIYGISGSDLADLLTEVKFELEWLERMQRPDGGVYHKVAGTEWPGSVTPGNDTQQRYVFGLSTFGTALYAGAMAMAGRVYAQYDSEFASRMVTNAAQAFGFLQRHSEPFFRHDDGQDAGSGPYRKETDDEERFWAAAELLRTTGDSRYGEYIAQNYDEQLTAPPTPIVWNDARLLGQWAYQAASEAPQSRREAVRETLLSRADELATATEEDGYRVSLRPAEYIWGSTRLALAKGNIARLAYELDAKKRYKTTAQDQIHYALGRSPTGYSYVTGTGSYAPENPHCRLTRSTDVDIPGLVVGGPNANGEDPVLTERRQSTEVAPAKCYVDSYESYGSNEPAIDYVAPLILAIGMRS